MEWQVFITDRAEKDLEIAYLNELQFYGPERASAWQQAISEQILGLADFPGPLAWAIDDDESERRQREVRRFLFRRSGKHQFRPGYYIYYTTVNSASENEPGMVAILRVRHAAQNDDP